MWERRAVKGGGGSNLCRAGAAAFAAHSPRAQFGAGGSSGSKLASTRSLGQQRGRPSAACTAASAALGGPGRSEGESESPGAKPGEIQLQEGACPVQPPPEREPGSARRPPRGPQSREHRSPQLQGWCRRRREARCSAPCRGSPPPADLPVLQNRGGRGLRAGRPRPKKLVVRAPLSARSERAREAAKRGGHGLGDPLLLPGTARPAVRAGAAWGMPAPRVPDARLHQPLGSQNRRRLPRGQPHR